MKNILFLGILDISNEIIEIEVWGQNPDVCSLSLA
jgi:hypothetical protein